MSIEHEINNCINTLRAGGIIIFPGETGWMIGCDVNNTEAVENILNLDTVEFPATLLDDSGKLTRYVKEIPDIIWDLIEFSKKPLHIILEKVVNIPSVLIHFDESTFSIVKDPFSLNLIHKFGKPVFAAVFTDQNHPSKQTIILNKPGYVVNLRVSSKANTENLVLLKLSPSGKIEFIKK